MKLMAQVHLKNAGEENVDKVGIDHFQPLGSVVKVPGKKLPLFSLVLPTTQLVSFKAIVKRKNF
jgi:hypothetical protein